MNPTIKQLEAAIAAANEKLAELKAAEATQAKKAWPHIGDTYWAIDDGAGVFVTAWAADDTDCARAATGNVFRTKADAEREVERQKVRTELRRLARESWGDGKADWSNSVQNKYRLHFDYYTEGWHASFCNAVRQQGAVWFATEQAAQAAVETIGAERLNLLLED